MNPQFKKGVLELIVLECVRRRDRYGYELVEEVSRVIDVNEGTIYPLLKRLSNDHLLESYLKESSEGPPRKYYHITPNGIQKLQDLEKELGQKLLVRGKYKVSLTPEGMMLRKRAEEIMPARHLQLSRS